MSFGDLMVSNICFTGSAMHRPVKVNYFVCQSQIVAGSYSNTTYNVVVLNIQQTTYNHPFLLFLTLSKVHFQRSKIYWNPVKMALSFVCTRSPVNTKYMYKYNVKNQLLFFGLSGKLIRATNKMNCELMLTYDRYPSIYVQCV